MLADEFPEMGYQSPTSLGGSAVSILLYVAEVDVVFRRAVAAGAEEVTPVADQFDGDRRGTLKDPFGPCGFWPRSANTFPSTNCAGVLPR